jgi:hypothetical protein
MRKFMGISLLVVCTISIIFILYVFNMEVIQYPENGYSKESMDRTRLFTILTIPIILIIAYYIIITLAGKIPVKLNSSEKIAYENELIKLKIEQRKLQNELKELQDNK